MTPESEPRKTGISEDIFKGTIDKQTNRIKQLKQYGY